MISKSTTEISRTFTIFSGQQSAVSSIIYYLYLCSKTNNDMHVSVSTWRGELDFFS